MASTTSDEIIRFFKCYVETVTDVLEEVVDEKLLQPKRLTLQQYLEINRHLFYHQTNGFKAPSCACPPAGCPLRTSKPTINQKVFYSLYDSTANVEIGHELQRNGRVEQTCIHKYVPKNIVLDDLDIGTMCFMLTKTIKLNHAEESCVNIIRNYRNNVCHEWSKKHYSAAIFNKMWTDLESSLLTLTCKSSLQRIIKREFLQHQRYTVNREEISEILEKINNVNEGVNQLQSSSDFDDFKNVCLQNNNTMQAAVCAKISEETETIREDIGNIGRNTDLIWQVIKNASITIDYPSRKLVPQNGFQLQGEGKILWQIETPINWDLENVEATVKDNIQLEEQPIKIKFVKTGSLYLLTTVPQSILNSPANFEMAVKSFLENLIDVCKFDTSMPCRVEVHLSFLEEGNDTIRVEMVDTNYQPTSNQRESRSNTSISTQTDVIYIRCPCCDDTIKLNFDVLDTMQEFGKPQKDPMPMMESFMDSMQEFERRHKDTMRMTESLIDSMQELEKQFKDSMQEFERRHEDTMRMMDRLICSMEEFTIRHKGSMEEFTIRHKDSMEEFTRRHKDSMEEFTRRHKDSMEEFTRQHKDSMEEFTRRHKDSMEEFKRRHEDLTYETEKCMDTIGMTESFTHSIKEFAKLKDTMGITESLNHSMQEFGRRHKDTMGMTESLIHSMQEFGRRHKDEIQIERKLADLRRQKEDLADEIQKERKLTDEIQKDREILTDLRRQKKDLADEIQKERKVLTDEIQKGSDKLADFRQQRRDIEYEIQEERKKLTDLLKDREELEIKDLPKRKREFEDLDAHCSAPTYVRLTHGEDNKHSFSFPKGTEKKTESTKDDKEEIPDSSYLFPESSLSYEKRTEKKTISTSDDKGVLDSEHIFPAKKQ